MTYRLSLESNNVNRDWPLFMLGVYEDYELAKLDAVALMTYLDDDIRTIAVKRFNGTDFVIEDVFDGQEWESDIIAYQEEEFERHGA